MKKVRPYEENTVCCAPENASLDCCQSAEGSSCCNPGNGKRRSKGKIFISAIIILAAIGVGANSIIKENSAQAGSGSSFASSVNENSIKPERDRTGQQTEGSQFSFNRVTDSLQAIDAQAADKNIVFIALPAKGQELPQTASKQMETILGKLPSWLQKVGASTLSTSAADYDRLVKRLEIKSFPCFVALGRKGSPAVIPGDGKLSEEQVFNAYLTALKGGEGCCPAPKKPTCCP